MTTQYCAPIIGTEKKSTFETEVHTFCFNGCNYYINGFNVVNQTNFDGIFY